MAYKEIEYEIQDKEIARIRLNAPSRMNAFNLKKMWNEFVDAVGRVQKNNLYTGAYSIEVMDVPGVSGVI